ncbi:MAG: hypothetical protein Kow0069_14760 [Promethearchaeota archaeon]
MSLEVNEPPSEVRPAEVISPAADPAAPPKWNRILLATSLAMLAFDFVLIFKFAMFERIVYAAFFYHVGSAWVSYACFGVSVAGHAAYLKTGRERSFSWAKNSVTVGLAFSGVTLLTGSIWFNATSGNYQGVYWNWDPRQTATLVMWVSYAGYLVFGTLVEDAQQRAKIQAVVGLGLFPTVPLSYLSVAWFSSLHPLIRDQPGQTGFIYWDPVKLFTLFFTLVAVTLLYVHVVRSLVHADSVESLALSALLAREWEVVA